MKKIKYLFITLILSFMVACATLQKYAEQILTLKQEYCSSEDPRTRQYYLELIRQLEPDYPGVCMPWEYDED